MSHYRQPDPPAFMNGHGFPDYHSDFFIDKVRSKYSWAKGASRGSDEAVSQHSRDLTIAFAEIDGLMAGFKYMDELQHLSSNDDAAPSPCPSEDLSSSPSYPSRLDIDLFDGPEAVNDGAPLPQASAIPLNQSPSVDSVGGPMADQWDALGELRKETERHHERFLAQTQGTDDIIIQSLQEEFPCAKKIRKTGLRQMRQILEGYKPQSIAEIFAFTSLSYAVSKILLARNRVRQSDILADFHVCRDSISDAKERSCFGTIAQSLWPEAQNGWGADGDGSTSGPYNTQDSPLCPQVIGQLAQTHQTWDFALLTQHPAGFGVDHFEVMTPGRSLVNSGNGQYDHAPQEPQQFHSSSFAAPQEPSKAADLLSSKSFLVVFLFYVEIEQLALTLSGQTLRPKPSKLFPTERKARNKFLKGLKSLFVESPLGASKDLDIRLRAFLSVALLLASMGYFETIVEVKHYMITVGGATLFPPGPLFENFSSWVLRLPSTLASPNLSPEIRKRKWGFESGHSSPSGSEDFRKRLRDLPTCSVDKCRGIFETEEDLRKHTKEMHRPYGCNFCDRTFARRDRLLTHMSSRHGTTAHP